MAKRSKPGDVLELAAPAGLVYLHYVGRHPEYGDGVVVCPTKHSDRVKVAAELFETGYVTFFPVAASVARGLATVVGNLPSPGLPRRLRRPGARSGREVVTWIP